jgi:hypothetical protein
VSLSFICELEDYLLLVPRRGLGVKNLMLFNKALLGKWLWRFVQEENSLWRQVIVEKYGVQRGVGVQRKLEGPMGCAFRGILGMAGGISPTLSPSRLGMDPH